MQSKVSGNSMSGESCWLSWQGDPLFVTNAGCIQIARHVNRRPPSFRIQWVYILHSANYQLIWPAATSWAQAAADERNHLRLADHQVIMSILETLQSLSREELIILLSVIVGSIILVTIIITILCVYCCRRANRSRGERIKLGIFCTYFLVEWYNVDKHALITMDDLTNVKGSVDLDFIMKMYK